MTTRVPLSRLRPAVIVSALVFALAGIMFAAAAQTSGGTDLRAQRAVELRDLVRQRSAHVNALEGSVAGQQQQVDSLLTADPALAGVRAELARLEASSGLAPVTGRSLTVTLDDAPVRAPDDPLWQTMTANDVIVHQQDVQAVVNALWRGGAEAIQVMDQRIIGTSSIQCVGNTLLLQGRVYSPPFVITAVGPVRKMRASLRDDPAVTAYRAWARAVGLGYETQTSGSTTIPAYTGPVETSSAVPSQ